MLKARTKSLRRMPFWAITVPLLRQLRESIDGGFLCQPYVVHDPLLQSNRNLPEFQNLMAQASHPHEQFKSNILLISETSHSC